MNNQALTPESTAETREIVLAARAAGSRLLPAGRRTWPGAGGWTRDGGTTVSTSRLDAVHHYEPADLTLTAGAGIGLDRLARIVGPNRQWLPFDAPGSSAGTLGAAVASGTSGPLRNRYGATRDNVLGLEVVTGDGRSLRIGGRVVKNVAGYDLVRLFTGSRGSLGIITRVSVRLFPIPEADETLLFAGGPSEAVSMARTVCTSEVPVAAAELVEGEEVGADRAMVLAVRLLGGPREVEESRRRIRAALGTEPWRALHDGASRRFHAARIGWEEGASLVARLAALPDRIDAAVAAARACATRANGAQGSAAITADVLQGLVRVRAALPDFDPTRLTETLATARREMEALGGSLTLSHAPPQVGARVGWTGSRRETAALTDRIKALFDPDSVLAPRCP
ncbi:MAG: FAD-binding oxidoreductase [Gemmatimonadota bacterium]|nr:FAD-binding oxidoreductase [Gemmatimonadota bacterium]MDE2864624.1 FAD-binding oxidoreductase [Gemmatimonadota bacterium]MYE16508.1 FAD-binding oxidoreductase [Gemmatimonadota bacterium]